MKSRSQDISFSPKSVLIHRLGLIELSVCLAYVFLDIFYFKSGSISHQIICMGFVALGLFYNYTGQFFRAKILILATSSISVFIFYSSIPLEHGIHMYFIPLIASSFLLFDQEEHLYSYLFAVLNVILFSVGALNDITVLKGFESIQTSSEVAFIINFTGAALITSAIVVISRETPDTD